ncbi:MAG: SdrD B-like domain-containing protein, partial [Actinomycetota bacterium]
DLDGLATPSQATAVLAPRTALLTYDFGYVASVSPPASVGDTVWLDANRNGAQDTGENGIPGVTVTLLSSGGATVATATTDSDGKYLFTQLSGGSYSVSVSGLPGALVGTYDLDGTGSANRAGFTLATSQDRRDVDFGYAPALCSVGDTVWLDADGDGVQDANESGIPNATVTLLNAAGATVGASKFTNGVGQYLFQGLEAGAYSILVSGVDANLTQTYDLDGMGTANRASFTLTPGQNRVDVDFGYQLALGSVGDTVWLDGNLNGTQESDEDGIPGVTVALLNSSGATVATATTDASGKYLFSSLSAGSYSITVANLPANLTATYDLDGAGSADLAAFDLTPGQNRLDVDFGYGVVYRGSLGDRVWYDINRNGLQDTDEPGVGGVRVDLISGNAVIATTTTDASGGYLFSNLSLGGYRVKFHSTIGYQGFTAANQGSNDGDDSDASVSTGETATLTLTVENRDVATVDAGLTATPTLSLRKTANRAVAAPGDRIVYSYTVTNTGGVAVSDVTVTDDNATPSYDGDDFVVGTVAFLAPGASATLTKTVIPALTMTASNGTVAGFMTAETLPNGDVKATFVQSLAVVDNTYGSGSSDGYRGKSGKGHTFKDLINSDHAEFRFTNAAGAVVLDFYVDDLSVSNAAPSGYGTLGVLGGDGYMIKGSAANVVSCWTSAAANLNQSPAYHGYTTNSPLNDANWEVRSIYSVVVKAAAFGASGFGKVTCPDVHNSPAKIDTANLAPAPQNVTNTAVATARFGSYVLTTTSATATVAINGGAATGADTGDTDTGDSDTGDTNTETGKGKGKGKGKK